jgi:hypothetical protein
VEEVERRLIIAPVLLRVPAAEWLAPAVAHLDGVESVETEECAEWGHRVRVSKVEHGTITPIGFQAVVVVQAGWVERPTVEWVRRPIFSGRVFSSAVVVVARVTLGAVEMVGTAVAVEERMAARPGVTD